MKNQYPEWLLIHKGEDITVAEWLKIIAEYYAYDFVPVSLGCPSKLSSETALQIFYEYANTGYMVYALDTVGLDRSTESRWRRKYQSIRDMYKLVKEYNRNFVKQNPQFCNVRRHRQIQLLQRERGGVSSPHKKLIGRPSAYSPSFVIKVEPTLEATALKLGVSKRTVITWMDTYPEFRKEILLKRLVRLLPIFEKQWERLEAKLPSTLTCFESDKEGPFDE